MLRAQARLAQYPEGRGMHYNSQSAVRGEGRRVLGCCLESVSAAVVTCYQVHPGAGAAAMWRRSCGHLGARLCWLRGGLQFPAKRHWGVVSCIDRKARPGGAGVQDPGGDRGLPASARRHLRPGYPPAAYSGLPPLSRIGSLAGTSPLGGHPVLSTWLASPPPSLSGLSPSVAPLDFVCFSAWMGNQSSETCA